MLQQLILYAAISCLDVSHQPIGGVAYNPGSGIASPTINPIVAPRIDHLIIPITIDPLRDRQAGNKPLRGKTQIGTATETPDGLVIALTGVANQIVRRCLPEPHHPEAVRPARWPKPARKLHKPLQR